MGPEPSEPFLSDEDLYWDYVPHRRACSIRSRNKKLIARIEEMGSTLIDTATAFGSCTEADLENAGFRKEFIDRYLEDARSYVRYDTPGLIGGIW